MSLLASSIYVVAAASLNSSPNVHFHHCYASYKSHFLHEMQFYNNNSNDDQSFFILWLKVLSDVLLEDPFDFPPLKITFMFTGIFKSTCYIDVRWFPFDLQRCDLKFGSWTYGGWSLDLQMIDADITGYIANGEWDLVGKVIYCKKKKYVCMLLKQSE